MSNPMDDRAREAFQSKFDHFEAIVDEQLWKGVAKGIGHSDGHDSRRKWIIWTSAVLFLIVVSVSGFYVPSARKDNNSSNSVENHSGSNVPESESTIEEVKTSSSSGVATDEESPETVKESIRTSSEFESSDQRLGEVPKDSVETPDNMVNIQEDPTTTLDKSPTSDDLPGFEKDSASRIDRITQLRGEETSLASDTPTFAKTAITTREEVDSKLEKQVLGDETNLSKISSEIRTSETSGKINLQLESNSAIRKEAPEALNPIPIEGRQLLWPEYTDEDGKVLVFETSRLLFRLNFGFTMNYLIVRPNARDNVLFEETTPPVDLSLKHLGLRIGYDIWYHAGSRFWLKNQIYLDARQHQLELQYDPDVREGEEVEFQRLLVEENIFSLGIATGLLYQIDNDDAKKRSVDLLISYEQNFLNAFDENNVFSYPKGVWSLNMGFTFSPKRGRNFLWLIRPFGYYSLNKGFGDKAAELAPFGFGVQFIRHR